MDSKSKNYDEAAKEYSFNIPSELFHSIPADFRNQWKSETEQHFKNGIEYGLSHQWKSVKDELPEVEVSVIVTNETKPDQGYWFAHRSQFPEKVQVDKYGFIDICPIEITHWMYIPNLVN